MKIKVITILFTLLLANITFANTQVINHEYTVIISSATGKNTPIHGTMMYWPIMPQDPVGFYDFKATKQLTPFIKKIAASEIMMNIASETSELKVEIITNDEHAQVPRLAGLGKYIMLYTDGLSADTYVGTR